MEKAATGSAPARYAITWDGGIFCRTAEASRVGVCCGGSSRVGLTVWKGGHGFGACSLRDNVGRWNLLPDRRSVAGGGVLWWLVTRLTISEAAFPSEASALPRKSHGPLDRSTLRTDLSVHRLDHPWRNGPPLLALSTDGEVGVGFALELAPRRARAPSFAERPPAFEPSRGGLPLHKGLASFARLTRTRGTPSSLDRSLPLAEGARHLPFRPRWE